MNGDHVAGLARMARGLGGVPDEAARLELAVRTACELIHGCDHAGITVHHPGVALTQAATDDVVRRANELQSELGEGPCLDTLRLAETIVSVDLSREERWPRWAPLVHRELGVASMLSVLLYTDKGSYGALSFYCDEDHGFDGADLAAATALAGHLAVSMAAGREIDHRGIGLASRTLIGQAVGMLMERYTMDADRGFEVLRRVSSETNTKLVKVAEELVRTGELPTASTQKKSTSGR